MCQKAGTSLLKGDGYSIKQTGQPATTISKTIVLKFFFMLYARFECPLVLLIFVFPTCRGVIVGSYPQLKNSQLRIDRVIVDDLSTSTQFGMSAETRHVTKNLAYRKPSFFYDNGKWRGTPAVTDEERLTLDPTEIPHSADDYWRGDLLGVHQISVIVIYGAMHYGELNCLRF